MDYRKLGFAVIGVLVVLWWKGQFLSMPKITRAGANTMVVGEPAADHGCFAIGDAADLRGACVGYEFNSMGLSDLKPLGVLGVLSTMNADAYAGGAAYSCKTGQCMAGFLNDAEAHGRIAHLLLIPADEAALSQMKKADLPSGERVRLSGHYLTYTSGTLKGYSFNGHLGGAIYFLVESIGKD